MPNCVINGRYFYSVFHLNVAMHCRIRQSTGRKKIPRIEAATIQGPFKPNKVLSWGPKARGPRQQR